MRLVILSLLVLPAFAGTDGWSKLETGTETVEVYRDGWGIPHVFAKSVEGAFWAEGFLEAEDRMWQLETFRRAAKGQLAEVQGEDAVKSDMERRRDGYTDAELQKMFDGSSERMRKIVTAYTAGVNAFLKQGRLPPQYAEAKHQPRAWHETDSLAIGVMMARRFGEAGDAELKIHQLYQVIEKKFGAEKATTILRDILRDNDPQAPATLNDHVRGDAPKNGKGSFAPSPVRGDFASLLRDEDEVRGYRESLGIPTYAGSNAWVVAPKKSASGRPILYGGPMMGFRTPSICDEIHLVAPGLNVAGMSFPGTPGVMIGWNEHIAFTTTSGGADLVDVYELEFNEAGEYRHGEKWLRLESFEVEIRVAGREPRTQRVRRSKYGPLITEPKDGKAYAKCMSFWMREQETFEAVMDFDFAVSVAEFAKAVPKVVTSHNWFAADREGHIGFWFAGAHPQRRKGHDPRFPQKGDGSMDWEGLVPFEKWPQSVDPPHGFFGNWNNKPARGWDSPYGKIFWGKKILDVLEGTDKLTFEQCERLARDATYHDFLADYFRPHILAAARDEKDADLAKAVELLEKYDLVKRDGRPEPALVEKWVQEMARRVFADEFGLAVGTRDIQRFIGDPLLYILEGNGALKYDFAAGVDLKAAAVASLREAMKGGLEKLAWKDETADFKSAGGKLKGSKGRGTFQMTVELGPDGPKATTLAPPGQSERADSPHHGDQAKLFEAWKYKGFVFRREEMK